MEVKFDIKEFNTVKKSGFVTDFLFSLLATVTDRHCFVANK